MISEIFDIDFKSSYNIDGDDLNAVKCRSVVECDCWFDTDEGDVDCSCGCIDDLFLFNICWFIEFDDNVDIYNVNRIYIHKIAMDA